MTQLLSPDLPNPSQNTLKRDTESLFPCASIPHISDLITVKEGIFYYVDNWNLEIDREISL